MVSTGFGMPASAILLRELVQLVRRFVDLAELLLDRLHLLVEVVLALALLHLRLDAAADALLICCTSISPSTKPTSVSSRSPTSAISSTLLLLGEAHARCARRWCRRGGSARRCPTGSLQQFRRQLAVELDVLLEQRHQRARARASISRVLARRRGIATRVRRPACRRARRLAGTRARVDAFDQHLDRAVGQLQQLQHVRERADLVQIRRRRVVDIRLLLRDQQDALVAFHRMLERAERLVAADEQRDDHVRKHHHVAQRQDRQVRADVGLG